MSEAEAAERQLDGDVAGPERDAPSNAGQDAALDDSQAGRPEPDAAPPAEGQPEPDAAPPAEGQPEPDAAPPAPDHPMRRIRLEKVVLNMGVGQSGPALEAAKKALEQISGCKPCPRSARGTQRDFGVRKGEPIGVAVTVRGAQAETLATRLFEAKGNAVARRSFDDFGNFSFGIREHIDIPGVKYDPTVGIIGLDVCVSLARPGYGIRKRSKHKARVGRSHRITADEARSFVAGKFGVEVAA